MNNPKALKIAIAVLTVALLTSLGCVTAKRNLTIVGERCCVKRVDLTGKITEQIIEQTFDYDVGRYKAFVNADTHVHLAWGTEKGYGYIHTFKYFFETPGGIRSELRFLECEDHESPIIIRPVQGTNLWLAVKGDAVFLFDHSGMIHRRKLKMRQYPKPYVVFAPENRAFTYQDYRGDTNIYSVLENTINPVIAPK